MHRVHADYCQHQAHQELPGAQRGGMPAVLLPAHVVPHLHGQVVCQQTGPAAPRDLAVEPSALPNLPSQILHSRCLPNTMSSNWGVVLTFLI